MKSLPKELDEKITEIKSWMLDGDQVEVAKRSGVAKSYVSRVLNKHVAPKREVLDAAIEVMNENKARFEIEPKMKIA
jgi:predicted transcriptional regulator